MRDGESGMPLPPIVDVFQDLAELHEKFSVHQVREFAKKKLRAFMDFRMKFMQEELDEIDDALMKGDAEKVVDGLIDLIVVAVGTVDAFEIDGHKAWEEVHRANMAKQAGANPTRPNEFGLPDLIKPEGWKPPSHVGNVGLLPKLFERS